MNGIVYDLMLLEVDRIRAHRMKDLDLYYKDKNGGFEKIAEAYNPDVEKVVMDVFKRKRARYLTFFTDAMDKYNALNFGSKTMFNFMVKTMSYGNILKDYTIRDIIAVTGRNSKDVQIAIRRLCDLDMIRFQVHKNRRTYMVNPSVFFKGSIKTAFRAVQRYESYPKRGYDLVEIPKENKVKKGGIQPNDIFS